MKISALFPAPAVTADDLIPIVDEPGGSPATMAATVAQILAVSAEVGRVRNVQTKAANYNLTADDEVVSFTTNSIAYLPSLPIDGQTFEIHALHAAGLTVDGNGHNIGGAPTEVLAQYDARIYTYDADNTVWLRVLQRVKLASEVTGTLAVGNGGTGQSAFAAGILQSDGSVISTGFVGLTTNVTGVLPVANGGTGQGSFAAGILQSDGSIISTGTVDLASFVNGTLAINNGGTGQNSFAAGVIKSNGSALLSGQVALGSEVSGNLPIGRGGTGTTFFGTGVVRSTPAGLFNGAVALNSGAGEVTSILPIANGGTGNNAMGAGTIFSSGSLLFSYPLFLHDEVTTNETTTSGAYTDLATVGPDVTLGAGTAALVIVAASIAQTGGTGSPGYIAIEVSGATTIAASDDYSATATSQASDDYYSVSRIVLFTGLNVGSNTFTAKYKSPGGGTIAFEKRSITVIPLW